MRKSMQYLLVADVDYVTSIKNLFTMTWMYQKLSYYVLAFNNWQLF